MTDIKTEIHAKLDKIEVDLKNRLDKQDEQIKMASSVDDATKNEIKNITDKIKEQSETLRRIDQKSSDLLTDGTAGVNSLGREFVNSDAYKNFRAGGSASFSVDIKNAATKSDDNTSEAYRVPGAYGASSHILTLEDVMPSTTTDQNAVAFTQESTTTDNVVQRAQGAAPSETDLQFTVKRVGVETISGWTVITRELAEDNNSLVEYINQRLEYMLNNKVESQIIAGNGTAPQLDGLNQNAAAHGFSKANVGNGLIRHALIRKIEGKLYNAGYRANIVILNPADAVELDLELGRSEAHGINISTQIVQSSSIAAGQLLVADTNAVMLYNNGGVTIRLNDQDATNARSGLITITGERRVALAVYAPSGLSKGTLSPA